METEAHAIFAAASRMESSVAAAAALILSQTGKVVVMGIGKSGHIARHLAATLQSTGTPAVFLHPSEAQHGDLGMYQPGDTVVMISKSGATNELLQLLVPLRERGARFIGILGNTESPLARHMDVVLDVSVTREADRHGFLPTSSSAVALSAGHALAVVLMEERGFGAQDFARLHSGGQLGKNLTLRVGDVMHAGPEVAWVQPEHSLKDAVIALSRHPLGAACVIAQDGSLLGLITDGDIRRAFEAHDDIRELRVDQVMTASPITVAPGVLLNEALRLMEDRPSQISVLPVVDRKRCIGLLRLHDIYRPAVSED
jgi:arabinose-5-phosphate isomerase